MIDWSGLAAAAPELAAFGRGRLERRIAYLATVRRDGAPRVHPVSPFFGAGGLFVYMEPTSPKGHDLRRDARYALHGTVEDNEGGQGELAIRGGAVEVTEAGARREAFQAAREAGYRPEARHVLFELRIAEALATVYEGGQTRRTRWAPEERR